MPGGPGQPERVAEAQAVRVGVEQLEAGHHRLRPRPDGAAFAHSAGPQSWKTYPHPQRERQWTADLTADGDVVVREEESPPPSYAFIGVRPCDLRAIAIQDLVLGGGPHSDTRYADGRRQTADDWTPNAGTRSPPAVSLRQLHHGLPHVFLHHRGGRHRSDR
jgi:hypothetical protein